MADGVVKASQILSMTRESEFLQSFLRVGLDSEPEETSASRPRRVGFKKAAAAAVAIMAPTPEEPESPESLQPSPEHTKLDAPTADARRPRTQQRNQQHPQPTPKKPVNPFTQIMREIKLRSMKKTPSKKSKGRQYEEVYTDKDRAAAVNIGGDRDIKTSLKMKKRQDRTAALQIPEETDSGALLALGNYEMRCGNSHIAIGFVDKALELNPSDKNALVARSKCYLLLGQPQLALQDAETALAGDKSFIRAIFQKAEALYHLGDFEHSLMYHHRGLRLRPELDGFRLGVQKAQQAIQNTIGKAKMMPSPEFESQHLNGSVRTLDTSDGKHSSSARSRPASNTSNKQERRLLGELCVDKEYLEDLLKNPDIKCLHQDAANHIALHAEEGIEFLKTRQEFWRQQKPNKPSLKKSKKL